MKNVKVISPGHKYDLLNFEEPHRTTPQQLLFIRKQPSNDDPTQLETVHNGTTNEAVLEMLINRLEFLDEKLPCPENKEAISHCRSALSALRSRTERRKKAGIEGQHTEEGQTIYTTDSEIPEEMPWSSYLQKNDLETIGDIIEVAESDGLVDLKFFNEKRAADVYEWLDENLA